MVIDLLVELDLDRIEQAPIDDGRLLACERLALEHHLSDVEPVAKQMSERPPCEGNGADALARLQDPSLADHATLAQVCHYQVEASKLEIAAEDVPHPVRLGFIDGDLAVFGVVANRSHAANPKTLPLRGRDLVADALGGDLALELGERQQHVEGQPSHRRGGVELLGHRDKRHAVPVEQLDQLGEVRQRTGQAVDLVDDDDVDLSGSDVGQQPLQGRAIGIAAGEATIVVFGPDHGPAGMSLALDIGL